MIDEQPFETIADYYRRSFAWCELCRHWPEPGDILCRQCAAAYGGGIPESVFREPDFSGVKIMLDSLRRRA
jgi:hypothetical protein